MTPRRSFLYSGDCLLDNPKFGGDLFLRHAGNAQLSDFHDVGFGEFRAPNGGAFNDKPHSDSMVAVLLIAYPLKVIGAIVSFYAVFMVYLRQIIWIGNKCGGNQSVQKPRFTVNPMPHISLLTEFRAAENSRFIGAPDRSAPTVAAMVNTGCFVAAYPPEVGRFERKRKSRYLSPNFIHAGLYQCQNI